jgi:hypothetical protein
MIFKRNLSPRPSVCVCVSWRCGVALSVSRWAAHANARHILLCFGLLLACMRPARRLEAGSHLLSHTHTHTYIYIIIIIIIIIYTYTYTCIHTYIYVCIYIYIYMYTCIYVYVYIYVCVCVCMAYLTYTCLICYTPILRRCERECVRVRGSSRLCAPFKRLNLNRFSTTDQWSH